MLRFLKVLISNVAKGPSTDPFPFKPAHTPERFRGRVVVDPEKCVGCKTCEHVCAGRCIRIENNADKSGYDFTVWHNSCSLCGMCRHYCPTKAITLSNDWHNAHEESQKFDWAEHHFIPYLKCPGCGAPIRMLPPDVLTRIYSDKTDLDLTEILKLCPNCRQLAAVERAEKQLHHELHEEESKHAADAEQK